jgi:hypothetical protein
MATQRTLVMVTRRFFLLFQDLRPKSLQIVMPEDNKNQNPTPPSSALWWQNPAIIVPIVVALIGVVGTTIANIHNLKGVFPNEDPTNTSPSNPSSNEIAESNEKFFVIAGRSEYPEDLANVPKTVKIKIGDSFNFRYQNIKICSLTANPKKYDLVIGSNLSNKDAEILKNKAIDDGFQKDTYVLSELNTEFQLSDCKPIKID